jgi:hypothetical protein
MDGKVQFMGVRKTGKTRGWMRIRGGIRRRKRKVARQKKKQFLVSKKKLTG